MMKSAVAIIFFLLCLVMVGCDENASSTEAGLPTVSGEPGAQPQAGEDPPTVLPTGVQAFNGGLTGRLVTSYQYIPYEFDLATGSATQLPFVSSYDFFKQTTAGENASKWNFFAANDNSTTQGFVETLSDCLILPSGSCLSVYDSNYQVRTRLTLDERNLEEAAKLSPSGKYVVMADRWEDRVTASLIILDVDASSFTDLKVIELVGDTREKAPYSPIMEWGPNDEVYYSVPSDNVPTVYITNPGTLDIDQVLTLPSTYTGRINNIDIHPDGRQLLMEYRANADDSSSIAVVLNLDTLNLSVPAVNEADLNNKPLNDTFVSQFKNPTWSPDGQYIMFLNTHTTGINPVLVPGIAPPDQYMIAVPANSDRLVVSGWQSNAPATLAPAIVIQVEDPSNGQLTSRWPEFNTVNNGHVEWVE